MVGPWRLRPPPCQGKYISHLYSGRYCYHTLTDISIGRHLDSTGSTVLELDSSWTPLSNSVRPRQCSVLGLSISWCQLRCSIGLCSHVMATIPPVFIESFPYSVYMYVAVVPNRDSPRCPPPRELPRRRHVHNRTIANLSHWPRPKSMRCAPSRKAPPPSVPLCLKPSTSSAPALTARSPQSSALCAGCISTLLR